MKMATGYRKLGDKKYPEALADFEAAVRVRKTWKPISCRVQSATPAFYIGYCRSKLGDGEGAKGGRGFEDPPARPSRPL